MAKTAAAAEPARREPTRGVLTVIAGAEVGRVIPIPDGEAVTPGPSRAVTARVPAAGLSRVHARLRRVAGGYVLQDLGSTNGSFVNGERVDVAAELADGDRVRLGPSMTLRFALVDAAEERALSELFETSRRDSLLAA